MGRLFSSKNAYRILLRPVLQKRNKAALRVGLPKFLMRKKNRHIPEKHGLHLHAGCRPQPFDATPLPAMAWEAAPHAQPHGLVQRTTRSSHFLATHTNYNYLYILPHWRTTGLHGPLAVRHGQTGPCRPDR